MSHPLDTLLRPSVLAMAIAFGSSIASAQLIAAEQTSATHAYDLPAASLASTLNTIASQAGLALSVDPSLVSGKTSATVKGEFDAGTAMRQALRGTGLQLQQNGTGGYYLEAVQEGTMALPDVNINAAGAGPDGSEAAGYVSENVTSVGALGGMKLQDTPYSMSVTSQAMLKNTMATSLDDVFKHNPFTQLYSPRNAGYASAVNMRGFSAAGNL
ncbi:MAG: secretin and TonB N-terminal domain-containing protein, partial [Pseudomonas caspiana]